MLRVRWFVGVLLMIAASAALFAQFDGFFRRRYSQRQPPPTEFVFARWEYSRGGDGWSHDYPVAEEHINQIMKEATFIDVEQPSYKIIPMESPEIFLYPFGYISEPGQMALTEEEIANFREFVDRGGFVMLDDFDGPRHFSIMKQNLERVFPDRQMFRMTDEHAILNTYYKIDSLYVESPYDVGANAEFWGINNDKGDLSVIICANNDIGDFWEYIDEPVYPVKPSAEALKLGINFILYAMTH